MNRRTFIKSTALTSIAISLSYCTPREKTHILTLSFDDGFKKSFYKIADIFEDNGLKACLNVIASGHLPEFQPIDQWILPELLGNFDDWNTLKQRGHEVMPHGWNHTNLAKLPLPEAKNLIIKCLDYFVENLEGYNNSEAIFNFPFNSSNEELEQFALSKVLGIRSYKIGGYNSTSKNVYRQGCESNGPDNIDYWVEKQVNSFLASKGGWLVLNLHGLENEGWGPISTSYLGKLLKRLVKIEHLEILPTGVALRKKY